LFFFHEDNDISVIEVVDSRLEEEKQQRLAYQTIVVNDQTLEGSHCLHEKGVAHQFAEVVALHDNLFELPTEIKIRKKLKIVLVFSHIIQYLFG